LDDDVPILVGEVSDDQKRRQAAWFDGTVDSGWEIARPNGAPSFHRFLLEEKFRRSTAGIDHLIPGSTALVVCGGSGMDAEFLARAGARVISSDISFGAARRAHERARRHDVSIDVIAADVERLPFSDASIDIVYVHDGLHHLERPLEGLAEMARVARRAVCVTEPARAAATRLAVHIGLALEQEDAGNRVARLSLDDVRSTLVGCGFDVVTAERYAMYYRHEPGRAVRFFSTPPRFALARAGFHALNSLLGAAGNKLVVVAVRA
jgi:SAM-dependent methyltransferase